jgi:predicted Zn finger-like uncharacterized protein
MRIVCPSCSATYDVPDSLLMAGRRTRCARCGGEWAPVEAGAAEPEREPATTERSRQRSRPGADEWAVAAATEARAARAPLSGLSAMERLAAQPTRPQSSLPMGVAWLGSLVLLAFLGWAAYEWRAPIIEAWPPSARIYAAFGTLGTDRTH